MKPFVLRTDASGVGVSAELLQENEEKLYPVGYASKKLSLTEARYPIIKSDWIFLEPDWIFLLMDRLSFINILLFLWLMHFNNDVLFIILIFY